MHFNTLQQDNEGLKWTNLADWILNNDNENALEDLLTKIKGKLLLMLFYKVWDYNSKSFKAKVSTLILLTPWYLEKQGKISKSNFNCFERFKSDSSRKMNKTRYLSNLHKRYQKHRKTPYKVKQGTQKNFEIPMITLTKAPILRQQTNNTM